MLTYQVKNIDIDVYNFKNINFCFDKMDIEVCSQYIDSKTYNIIVRRLDSNQGWNDDIQVLIYYREQEHTQIVQIGPSQQEHEKIVEVTSDFSIEKSDVLVNRTPIYNLIPFHQSIWMGREQFNDMFSTDIVLLPTSMYAVGLARDGYVYIYNETHSNYFMIDECIRHIIQVALTYTEHRHFYFIISAYDGYMEGHYNHVRTIPRQIRDIEYLNKPVV
jgi:hypothetical protein